MTPNEIGWARTVEKPIYLREDLHQMAKKKQFVTAAAAFAVAASAVAPAITADAASTTVRLSSDYVRGGDLDAALDKEYKGSEIYWYKSSIDMNKLGVFQTAKGFVKGKGIKVEKKLRVLNYAQEIKPASEFVFEQGVPVSGIRVQPVLFADGIVYNKPLFVAGFSTEKVGEFEGTLTYSNKAYGSVTKKVKYKVVEKSVETPVAEVATVGAINNTTFEVPVTFEKEVTADQLKGTKLTLKGKKDITASFSKLDGQTAVYAIDNKGALQPGDGSADGTYTVSSTGLTVKEGTTTTYGEVLTGNMIKGFISYKDGSAMKPVANATVKVGDRSVMTDDYGFYSIASNSGERTVEVVAPGFFNASKAGVEVSRNYVTAQNIVLTEFEQSELQIDGVALNEENSKPIENAVVELHEKRNGSFVKVGEYTTKTNGKFSFGNTTSDADEKFATDELELNGEYKVVIQKGLTASNLTDVYKAKTQEFKLSQARENTNLGNAFVTPVKELESLTFDLTWTPEAAAAYTTGAVSVELLAADGKSVLKNADLSNLRSTSDNRVMPEAYDLVKKDFFGAGIKPRIPTGTYFMRVKDTANAITIIPVSVSEGVNAVAPKTEITEAKSYSLTSAIGSIQYQQGLAVDANLAADPFVKFAGAPDANFLGDGTAEDLETIAADGQSRTANKVDVDFSVTQNVGGVDVVVYENVDAETFKVEQGIANSTFSNIKVEAKTDFTQLKQGVSYKATPVSSPFVKSSATTFSPAGAASSGTATFVASAKVAEVTAAGLPADIKVNNLQLINKAGQVVAETGAFETASATLKDAEQIEKLSGFTAGEYKLRYDIAGYKVKETSFQTIYDFQEAAYSASGFEAIAKTTVTGFVRYAKDNADVLNADAPAEASIILVNANGQIVAAKDLGVSAAGTYTVTDGTDGKLAAGTYTAIVRGPKFETIEKSVTIEDNKENVLNFSVEAGGKGLAKLAIRDENNNAYTGTGSDITFTDARYSDRVASSAGVSLAGISYTGVYESVTNSGVERLSPEALSKGTYKLNIARTGTTLAYSDTFTLANTNDTFYKVVQLANIVSGKTINLDVKFPENATEIDHVIVKKDGMIVGKFAEASVDTAGATIDQVTAQVGANATYTVEVYSSGKFVGSNTVTVQDFNTSVSVALDPAKR